MTLEILVACRRSPAAIVGASTPIAVLDVGASHRMWLWYPRERTSRLLRETQIAGVVSILSTARWADFAIGYASLIARTFDGVAAIEREVQDTEPVALDERALAIAWRDLDSRAAAAVDDHQRATRRGQLAWEASAVWLDSAPVRQPRTQAG